MPVSQNLKWIYAFSAAFIAANLVSLYFEFYFLTLVPLALLIVGLALFASDKLLLVITFLTPLSVSLEDVGGGVGIILPTEPLMFGVMLIFYVRLFWDQKFDSRTLRHPVTVAILLNLFWIFITTLTSEEPLVSIKYTISRLWFVTCFYFMATQLFREGKNFRRYLWMYIVPMTGVIIYTVILHAGHNFEEKPAHWVMQPFFKDHTSYGALIAMFIPVIIAFLYSKELSLNAKIICVFLLSIFLLGVILSYTRAAWVSLVAGLAVFLFMRFKVKFGYVVALTGIAAAIFFTFQTEIFQELEKNKQDSSSDLTEHVESISNVASDASNLERLNRWNAALRMFEERPIFGWGPGSYMFLYAPFQHSSQLTIISTNFGDGGNAHSEFFGPLAESGVLGILSFLAVVIAVLYTGITLYTKLKKNTEVRIILIGVLIGYITYIVHGTLNNFLDTDKASVPFWGFAAIMVTMDLYYRKRDGLSKETSAD